MNQSLIRQPTNYFSFKTLLLLAMGSCLLPQSMSYADVLTGAEKKSDEKLTRVHVIKRSVQPQPALAGPSSSNRVMMTSPTRAAFQKVNVLGAPQTLTRRQLRSKSEMLLADNNSETSSSNIKQDDPENYKLGPAPYTKMTSTNMMVYVPKWHFRIRSYNAMDLDGAEGASGNHSDGSPVDRELRAFERVDLRYDLTPKLSLALMPQFYHTWFGDPNRPQDSSRAGLNQNYSFNMGDTALIVNDDELVAFTNDFVLNGFARYDVPTSETSQKDSSNGSSWLKAGLAKKLGKFGFELSETYRQFYQTATTSSTVSPTGTLIQNLDYRFDTVLDSTYDVTSWFGLFFEVGVRSQKNYADYTNNLPSTQQSKLIVNPELDFTASKTVSFALGIFEMPNASIVDQQKYTPLSGDSQNANEAYLQATIAF